MSPALALAALLVADPGIEWKVLGEGLDYASIPWVASPVIGDGILHVVRIDPSRADVVAVLASEADGNKRTAAAWAKAEGLAVTMNLGMFAEDHLANVGHLRKGDHRNQPAWHPGHQAIFALGPGAVMFDLDHPATRAELPRFGTVIQNLRLLKGDGTNVWKPNKKRWSEAAVGVDKQGRVFFVFCRTPLEMYDFAARLTATLAIVKAMHVEGGPEASLSIHAGGIDLDLAGSYETGFNENDDNHIQWPIPNVLGVRR